MMTFTDVLRKAASNAELNRIKACDEWPSKRAVSYR